MDWIGAEPNRSCVPRSSEGSSETDLGRRRRAAGGEETERPEGMGEEVWCYVGFELV